MSQYDGTPDGTPDDMAEVRYDDALIEALRRSLSPEAAVIWDDDEEDTDLAVIVLRSLQRDVAPGLPVAAAVLPVRVAPSVARQRRLGRSATVAAIAAGVLSIGGVAAASAPGQPLAGVRAAVSSAMAHVVDALNLDAPVRPTVAKPTRHPTAEPSPTPTQPGEAGSAAARSAAASRQVGELLDKAVRFLDRGQYNSARAQLRSAAVRLPFVADAASHDRLAARLSALQSRLAAPRPTATSHQNGSGKARPEDKGGPTAKPRQASSGPTVGDKVTIKATKGPKVEKTALPHVSGRPGPGH